MLMLAETINQIDKTCKIPILFCHAGCIDNVCLISNKEKEIKNMPNNKTSMNGTIPFEQGFPGQFSNTSYVPRAIIISKYLLHNLEIYIIDVKILNIPSFKVFPRRAALSCD